MEFAQALKVICEKIEPRTILEFGSGESTTVFSQFGKVTSVEYSPPGDWHGVGDDPNVDFVFVEHEEQNNFPKNLLETFYRIVMDSHNEPGVDYLRETYLMKGQRPKWDLAYIDGAVHVKDFCMKDSQPGWVGGDLSYVTRLTLAGLALAYARFVIVDDISFMPMLHNVSVQTIGNRFSLLTRSC